MTQYWWVNHNKTYAHERGEGYLWSPKRSAGGARNQFYENMHLAQMDDYVVSFASSRIKAIGRVAGSAVTANKPAEFGATGENWAATGWLLPVSWQSVQHEVRPTHHLETIAPLLPSRYSPIHPVTGFGAQNAYLAQISKELFEEVIRLTGGPVAGTSPACDVEAQVALAEEAEVADLYQNLALSATERRDVIAARCGQGIFRTALLARDSMCAITGVSDPRLLRASHIKPWRLCSTAAERLSPANGLLLTPTFDHLFDKGLLTFDLEGNAIFSEVLSREDIERLGLAGARVCYSLDHHAEYLDYHRREIFVKGAQTTDRA